MLNLNKAPYSTMIVKLVDCFTDPDVAVTVAVVVVALVCEELDEPPQPENRPNPARPTATRRSSLRRLLFLKPSRQKATASVVNGNIGRESRRSAEAVVDELTESEVVAAPPCGTVMGFGLKVQV